jgi:hypothetical protein
MKSQTGRYSYEGAMDAWSDALYECLQQPSKFGEIPRKTESLPGIMTKLGIPGSIQELIREKIRIKVKHQSPGSEWPTNSGSITDLQIDYFNQLADRIECDF